MLKSTKVKSIFKIIFIVIVISVLTGCQGVDRGESPDYRNNETGNVSNNLAEYDETPDSYIPEYTQPNIDDTTVFEDAPVTLSSDEELREIAPQLFAIQDDEEIAVITTNHGVIYVRFFPMQAPLAVENFITHARNGFYDGLIFHRVMEDFMIQGGCPLGTGGGGTTIWGHGIDVEATDNLVHLRGALSMANTGRPMSTGSQFFIVQTDMVDEDRLQNLPNDTLAAAYREYGGTQWLDGMHTVFGQVFRGMDVVDAIANVPVTWQPGEQPSPWGQPSRPIEPVNIESIEIIIYSYLD